MEENELMNQMWEEFDELTGWRDIDFEANIIKEEEHDVQWFVFHEQRLEKSTVLKINVGTVNQNKELKAYKVLSLYAGYEVVGFTSNWVALIAPVCLSQNKEEKTKWQ